MSKKLYQWIFRFIGVKDLYNDVVVEDRLTDIKPKIRRDLVGLLSQINRDNAFFKDKFTDFLASTKDANDEQFFEAYSKLPSLSKQDYAEAGQAVMSSKWAGVDPKEAELKVKGKPLQSLRRLRKGDYLMPMATGGSTSML